jgi:hypothetical protein
MEDIQTQESQVAVIASWVCIVASFILSAITWVALGDIGGYGSLRYVMPAVVDSYIVCCIVTWLAPVSPRVARFAFWNMYGAAFVGVAAQSIYHCATVWESTHSTWKAPLALVLGAIPPAFAFAGVHIRGMASRDRTTAQAPDTRTWRESQRLEPLAPAQTDTTPAKLDNPAQTPAPIASAPQPTFRQIIPPPPTATATQSPVPQPRAPQISPAPQLSLYQSNKLAVAAKLYGQGKSPKQVATAMRVSLRSAQRYQAQLANGHEVTA